MHLVAGIQPRQPAMAVEDQFPVGLRVLVVDDDMACLKILEQMLLKCLYRVTICCRATEALSLLRERRGAYDVVISDVHMPDMDGFKLLELVGLEMDLPVIMMSADGRTSAVMRGIKHGACDYLIKPVRIEELKNIWQHVVRKRGMGSREHDHSGSVEDSDHYRKVEDDNEYASSVIEGSEATWKPQKKKRDTKEEEDGEENEDPSSSKKPRVVWSVELHQQFVTAVNQLGIDKAVPKRILEMMNVPGLTRENVASHLQKFRLYLKRLSGVAQQQSGLPNPFYSPTDTNTKVGPLTTLDIQTLAASGQISPQTLAALHAEMLGRPSGCLVLPTTEQQTLLQAPIQDSKCIPFQSGVAHGQPLLRCQTNVQKHSGQSSIPLEGIPSGFSNWSSCHPGIAPSNSLSGVNHVQNGNAMLQMLQQQQFPAATESHHAINVQPSCVVVPSHSSNSLQIRQNSSINPIPVAVASHSATSFQVGSSYPAVNPNSESQSSCKPVDYNILSSQSRNMTLDVGQFSNVDFKNVHLLKGYTIPGSATVSSCSGSINSNAGSLIQNSAVHMVPGGKMSNVVPTQTQGIVSNVDTQKGHGQGRSLGFVGRATCIPRRFAMDDCESPYMRQERLI